MYISLFETVGFHICSLLHQLTVLTYLVLDPVASELHAWSDNFKNNIKNSGVYML